MQPDAEAINRAMFEDSHVVKRYSDNVDDIGLWASEDIIFMRYLTRNDIILDIGCGAGRTTINLYRMGYSNIVGLDVSEPMIAAAKKNAERNNMPIRFYCSDARTLPFPDAAFDSAIFSFNGLMTIQGAGERHKVLTEIARVVKPGGVFIFTTHDRASDQFADYWKYYEEVFNRGEMDPRLTEYGDLLFLDDTENVEGFLHVPSREEVVVAAEAAGFELIYCSRRSLIARETSEVSDIALDCIFWVVRRKVRKPKDHDAD